MNWFRNVAIRNKFLMIFGVFLLLVGVIVFYAILSIKDVMANFVRITEGPNQRLLYASDATVELMDLRRNNVTMSTYGDNPEAAQRIYVQCNNTHEALLKILDSWEANLKNDPFLPVDERRSQLQNLTEVRKKLAEYMDNVKEMYGALVLMRDARRVAELNAKSSPIGNQLVNQIGTSRKLTQLFIDYQMKDASKHADQAMLIIGALAALILFVSLARDLFISYLITSPINKMNHSVKEIEKGNLKYAIRIPQKDELGQLSNHIGDMVDKIAEMNSSITILDQLEVMIFITDMDYNLLSVNDLFCRLKGVDRMASIGKKCYSVVSEADEPCVFCPLPDFYAKREALPTCDWERPLSVVRLENPMEQAMGPVEGQVEVGQKHDLWYSCRSAIIRWTDGSPVLFNAYTDETMMKRHLEQLASNAHEAEEASRIKSSFLANMSHEIRTPMNSIIGFSELALDDNTLSPKTKDFLDKIKSSSEGLLGIINDILDISKIEAGKVVLENIPFDLHEVFKVCQNIITPKAAAKNVELFCYSEPTLGKKLIGDPVRLRQVILNLLTNAVKFTNYGIVKVLASVLGFNDEASTADIHFEVKDSGIGMNDEQLSKVFDPFTQADNSTTRKYGGTGLGLSITKNFVELMGGDLKVESAIGIGSKFYFDVTFPTCDADTKTESFGDGLGGGSSDMKKPMFKAEILVCEDNEMNQIVITEHLARVGIKTVIAENGKVGVEAVSSRMAKGEKLFDLIFMDVHMPVMDGLEAVKKLAEIGNTIPIVALTANVMTTDREAYKEYGMNEYLSKPFAAQDLWGCLLNYIKPIPREEVAAAAAAAAPPAPQAAVPGAVAGAPAGAPQQPQQQQPPQAQEEDEDEKLRMRLISNFLKDNKTKDQDIKNAIDAGDIKLAHRLAHTLKGVAGLVGQPGLQSASYAIENALNTGDVPTGVAGLGQLQIELAKTLAELTAVWEAAQPKEPAPQAQAAPQMDKFQALELIDKVRPLLESGDSDCIALIEGLRSIPESKKLIEQVEDYDFELALETLDEIKRGLGA